MTAYNGLQDALNTLLEKIQTKHESEARTLNEYLNKKYADIENDKTAIPLDKYKNLKTCWETDLITQFRELTDAVDLQEIENVIRKIDASLENNQETKTAPSAKICRSPGLFSIPSVIPDEDKNIDIDAFARAYQKLKEAINKYCSDSIENAWEMLSPENVNASLNTRFKNTLKRYREQEISHQQRKKIQLTDQEFQNLLVDQLRNKLKKRPTEKEYINEIRQAFFYEVHDRKLTPNEYENALNEEFDKEYVDLCFRYVIPAEAVASTIKTHIQKIEEGKPAPTPAERFEALVTYWQDNLHRRARDKIIEETIEDLEKELYESLSPRAHF